MLTKLGAVVLHEVIGKRTLRSLELLRVTCRVFANETPPVRNRASEGKGDRRYGRRRESSGLATGGGEWRRTPTR